MAAHSNERAQQTGDFHCTACHRTGEKIPPCPCGGHEYESRTNEPGNES